MLKENKGITLVALVVTIIVLLILAGVTISLVLGQQGIFNKANEANEATVRSEVETAVKMAVLEAQVGQYTNTGSVASKVTVANLSTNVDFVSSMTSAGYKMTGPFTAGTAVEVKKADGTTATGYEITFTDAADGGVGNITIAKKASV